MNREAHTRTSNGATTTTNRNQSTKHLEKNTTRKKTAKHQMDKATMQKRNLRELERQRDGESESEKKKPKPNKTHQMKQDECVNIADVLDHLFFVYLKKTILRQIPCKTS